MVCILIAKNVGDARGTGNRYRAYPTNEQRMLIKRFGGSCRFVKNLGKQQRDFAWKHR
ncbi:MAG: helix-turn-helix domain-containing protein, partial [Acidimicrobiales bacterium]